MQEATAKVVQIPQRTRETSGTRQYEELDEVVAVTRMYFVREYHAGTREMIYRYAVRRMGRDVSPVMISAALTILKRNAEIVYEKRVWWNIAVK